MKTVNSLCYSAGGIGQDRRWVIFGSGKALKLSGVINRYRLGHSAVRDVSSFFSGSMYSQPLTIHFGTCGNVSSLVLGGKVSCCDKGVTEKVNPEIYGPLLRPTVASKIGIMYGGGKMTTNTKGRAKWFNPCFYGEKPASHVVVVCFHHT